jgi:hypothetical protein
MNKEFLKKIVIAVREYGDYFSVKNTAPAGLPGFTSI